MNQPIEKKVDLEIDFREQRSGIIEELSKLNNQLTIEVCTPPMSTTKITKTKTNHI